MLSEAGELSQALSCVHTIYTYAYKNAPEFPVGPVVRTQHFQWLNHGHWFHPWLGNQDPASHKEQAKKQQQKSSDAGVNYGQLLGSPVPISLAKFSHLRCFQSPFRVFPPELVPGLWILRAKSKALMCWFCWDFKDKGPVSLCAERGEGLREHAGVLD